MVFCEANLYHLFPGMSRISLPIPNCRETMWGDSKWGVTFVHLFRKERISVEIHTPFCLIHREKPEASGKKTSCSQNSDLLLLIATSVVNNTL